MDENVVMNVHIIAAINEQIRLEFDSAFLYLSFSVNLKEYGLRGAAHWMRQQYQEECGHAMRLISYLEKCGAKVLVPSVEKICYAWNTPLDIFEYALRHEQMISGAINELMTSCHMEKDYATQDMLFYFVREQVEEESSVRGIVEELRLCEGRTEGILRVDAQLMKRPAINIEY